MEIQRQVDIVVADQPHTMQGRFTEEIQRQVDTVVAVSHTPGRGGSPRRSRAKQTL